MKSLLLLASLVSIIGLASGEPSLLTTPFYVIEITEHCAEGEVGCNDVTYVGTNKKQRVRSCIESSASFYGVTYSFDALIQDLTSEFHCDFPAGNPFDA